MSEQLNVQEIERLQGLKPKDRMAIERQVMPEQDLAALADHFINLVQSGE